MHILKSGIAPALFLGACTAYAPVADVQPLLAPPPPAEAPVPAPRDNGALEIQAISAVPAPAPEAAQPVAPRPRSAAEVAFIKAKLNAIQPRSIVEDREYCGYLGTLPNGDFAISGPKRGAPAGCTPDNPPADLRIIASYHTHAAYAPRFDSEVPSATDLEGDISEGINGYVSTPGGRVWYSDSAARSTTQICGIGCVAADPRFRPDQDRPVQQSYSLAALRQRQN